MRTEVTKRGQEKREQFFVLIDKVRERNKDIPPEVIEDEVEEAVRAARENK